MIERILKYAGWTLIALAAFAFVVRASAPKLMQAYIKAGIGDCAKIPVLCKMPSTELIEPAIDTEYVKTLAMQEFSHMVVFSPKGFSVIQETEKKIFSKKNPVKQAQKVIYVLCREEWFFAKLFKPMTKEGVDSNYSFLERVMNANPDKIRNVWDMFFVIMKSIFIPDLGAQETCVMSKLKLTDNKGFLSYNLTPQGNYFNCDITNSRGEYFKVYIRDKTASLGLDEALAVISTVSSI